MTITADSYLLQREVSTVAYGRAVALYVDADHRVPGPCVHEESLTDRAPGRAI